MQICTRLRCMSLGQAPDVCLHTSDKTGCRRYPCRDLAPRLLAGAGEEVPQFMLDIQELDIQRDRRCDLTKKKVIRNKRLKEIGEGRYFALIVTPPCSTSQEQYGEWPGPLPCKISSLQQGAKLHPTSRSTRFWSFQASAPALLPAPRWAERACDASLGVQTHYR